MNTEPLDILLQAIKAKWESTLELGVIAGPWFGDRDSSTQVNPAIGTHFPYAVFPDKQATCSLTRTTCANTYHVSEIVLRIYDTSNERCSELAAIALGVFDSQTLSMPLASGKLVRNKQKRIRYVEERKGNWYADVTFEFETSYPVRT